MAPAWWQVTFRRIVSWWTAWKEACRLIRARFVSGDRRCWPLGSLRFPCNRGYVCARAHDAGERRKPCRDSSHLKAVSLPAELVQGVVWGSVFSPALGRGQEDRR
jgi:hypothetical protein